MEDTKELRSFFERDFPLNREGLEEVLSLFKTREYKKGSLLLQEGRREEGLRFLRKGIVREFYVSAQRQVNINFYIESQFITDFPSLHAATPTKKYQECISKAEVQVLDKVVLERLLAKYECGRSIIEQTFKKLLLHREKYEHSLLTKPPEEVYIELVKNRKQWLEQIPQYHIASYLGVTPETLSRIRKRIS